MEKRTVIIPVRVSPSEKVMLEKISNEKGTNTSTYMRMAALEKADKESK